MTLAFGCKFGNVPGVPLQHFHHPAHLYRTLQSHVRGMTWIGCMLHRCDELKALKAMQDRAESTAEQKAAIQLLPNVRNPWLQKHALQKALHRGHIFDAFAGCGTSRGFAGLCPCTALCPQATHLYLAGASLPCSPPLPLHPSAAAASLGGLLKGKFAESLLLRPMSPTEGAINAISILHTMPCCSRQEGLWHIITITWTAQEMAISAKALTCTQ